MKKILLASWRVHALIAVALVLMAVALFVYGSQRQGVRTQLIRGNYQAAYATLIQRARAGDAGAQNSIGNMYYLGLGVEKDYRQAAEWYLRAALNGNIAARVNSGHLYNQGLGVKKDFLRAYAWFVHARKAGSDTADNYLKEILSGFEVVPNMMQRAMELYPSVESMKNGS